MKKLMTIYLLILFGISAKSQNVDYQTKTEREESEREMNVDRQRMKDNHIAAINVYSFKPDRSQTSEHGRLSSAQILDKEGNVIDYKNYKKNGKTRYHSSYQYDRNGNLIEFKNWKSNERMLFKAVMTYDSAGNFTDQREYWKNPDKLLWHSISKYDDKQNLVEMTYLLKDDKKLIERYVYSYYSDGSKKQTIEYNRKNKVRHIWNFDCNPVGKLEGSNLKDTSKICVRYETDIDGNKIKIKEENTAEGKYKRMISKFDQNNNLVDFTGYNSRQRIKYHSHSIFDGQNNIVEFNSYRASTSEIKERNLYKYDSSGILVELITYKKSPLPDRVVKFNYVRQQ